MSVSKTPLRTFGKPDSLFTLVQVHSSHSEETRENVFFLSPLSSGWGPRPGTHCHWETPHLAHRPPAQRLLSLEQRKEALETRGAVRAQAEPPTSDLPEPQCPQL